MYKKYWLLIQETDEHGHHAAYIRPVTSSDNIASICKALPSSAASNIYPTKKAADIANRKADFSYLYSDNVYANITLTHLSDPGQNKLLLFSRFAGRILDR